MHGITIETNIIIVSLLTNVERVGESFVEIWAEIG
jgi:hypothetical protein